MRSIWLARRRLGRAVSPRGNCLRHNSTSPHMHRPPPGRQSQCEGLTNEEETEVFPMAEKKPNAVLRPNQGVRRSTTHSGVTHVRTYQSGHYTVVGNHLAQHRELSLTAIGLVYPHPVAAGGRPGRHPQPCRSLPRGAGPDRVRAARAGGARLSGAGARAHGVGPSVHADVRPSHTGRVRSPYRPRS